MLRYMCVLATILLASVMLVSTDANGAAAQRTFVASHGNDANPCTLALPCRGFAAALVQTTFGGELIVLDSAGYGPVTITGSVSIIAPPGIYAGITVPSTGAATGVLIASVGVNVVLQGLTINGAGGTYGVRMTDGSRLAIEKCVISNFASGLVGAGVSIETAAFVNINGTTIKDGDNGVVVGYGAIVNIANSQILVMNKEGIELTGGPSGTSTGIFISDTMVTGTGSGGFSYCVDNFPTGGAKGVIEATRVAVTSCGVGFWNEPQTLGPAGTMTVSHSMATNGYRGFYNSGGTFQSLGDNHVAENDFDIGGAITIIGGH